MIEERKDDQIYISGFRETKNGSIVMNAKVDDGVSEIIEAFCKEKGLKYTIELQTYRSSPPDMRIQIGDGRSKEQQNVGLDSKAFLQELADRLAKESGKEVNIGQDDVYQNRFNTAFTGKVNSVTPPIAQTITPPTAPAPAPQTTTPAPQPVAPAAPAQPTTPQPVAPTPTTPAPQPTAPAPQQQPTASAQPVAPALTTPAPQPTLINAAELQEKRENVKDWAKLVSGILTGDIKYSGDMKTNNPPTTTPVGVVKSQQQSVSGP